MPILLCGVLRTPHLQLSNWNRGAEPADFASAFPRLFRFPDKMRRLAAATLWNMEKKTGKAVVSDAVLFSDLLMATDDKKNVNEAASLVTSLGRGRLPIDGFLGAHLRVAEDAAKAKWPGYEAQAPAYLNEAAASQLSVIYLATGSAKHREMFKADAAARKMSVVTKEALLGKDELAELQSLTWDQQAIVDFEVLVHSSRFAGFLRSSFSWVVAIRRSILPEAGLPTITKRDFDGGLEGFGKDRVPVVRREGHARRQEAAVLAASSAASSAAASAVSSAVAAASSASAASAYSSATPVKAAPITIATAAPVPIQPAPPAKAVAPAPPAAPAKAAVAAAPVAIVEKFRDGLSVVVGRFDGMTINAIWP
ncbi:hypothetical protein SBRCBS47491_002570 [Sporothrix bragantina]|uniref:Uncharacterized protein n=1 Tax=Sporothrix bragantina TaxID=671064 RepID=A0ABP0B900_9PEZI